LESFLSASEDLDKDRDVLLCTARFPIDAVYTWVDDSDPKWQRERAKYCGAISRHSERSNHPERFRNRDELRYSLRSIEMYAPFIRQVFIVTSGQVPEWLRTEHPKITLVTHEEIYRDVRHLPTFNSSGIETQLHHIEGLSEHFL